MPIPEFDPVTGALPAGIHEATWPEVVARFGINAARLRLLSGLRRALDILADAGCTRVYLGGSFVAVKAKPGDWDLAWEQAGVDVTRLHPTLAEFALGRLAQKRAFYGESFPANWIADPATGETFLEFSSTRIPTSHVRSWPSIPAQHPEEDAHDRGSAAVRDHESPPGGVPSRGRRNGRRGVRGADGEGRA